MSRFFTLSTCAGAIAVLALAAAAPGAQAQDRERRGPPGDRPAGAQAPGGAPTAAPGNAPAPQATVNTGATGSYLQSCRKSTNSAGRIFSECRNTAGQYRRSSIEAGLCRSDISNQNGILACTGTVAQDGGLVVETPAPTASGRGGRTDQGRSGDDRYGGYGAGGSNSSGYERGGYERGGYDSGRSFGGQGPDPRSYDNGRDYGGQTYDPRGGGDQGYGSRGYGAPAYGGRNDYGRRPADLVLFEGPNYTGRSFEVRGDIDDLKSNGFNDRARSAKVYSGRWKLCRESDYRRCEHVTRDVPDLNAINAGGQVSSVERE